MTDFADKVALVTGTSGIGRSSARRLAAGGAKVLALGIDPAMNDAFDTLAKSEGLTMSARLCDVSDDTEVAAAVRDCIGRYGRLDILVNNLGSSVTPAGGFSVLTDEDWESTLQAN
ncbi:MAG: SDR family NAD(P)-dependent oxidoreductase, partial [Acetobacteraceae bacterium]